MLQITTYSTLLNYCTPTTINSSKLTTQSTPHHRNAIQLSWTWCYSLWTLCNFHKPSLNFPSLHKSIQIATKCPQIASNCRQLPLHSTQHQHNATYRLQLVQIVVKSSKLTPNLLRIASTSPQMIWDCSESSPMFQNFAESSQIDPDLIRDIIECLTFPLPVPELSPIVANRRQTSPNRPKCRFTYTHDITECRNPCSIDSPITRTFSKLSQLAMNVLWCFKILPNNVSPL